LGEGEEKGKRWEEMEDRKGEERGREGQGRGGKGEEKGRSKNEPLYCLGQVYVPANTLALPTEYQLLLYVMIRCFPMTILNKQASVY